MRIDWWTLGLQTINLLVLLWLLGRFFFRPMAKIVAERQAAANELLDAARKAQDKAEAAVQEAQAERDRSAAAREAVLDAARKEAEAQRAKLIETAHAEALRKRSEAETAIDHARSEAEAQLARQANVLATDVAAHLLEGPGARLPVGAFLPELEQALAELPGRTRSAIATPAAPASLISARPLADDDAQAARTAVSGALGHDATLSFDTDPSLVAGLRLSSGMVVLDVNLRADLDRVLAGLDSRDG
ncbi:F0F1 ATP synthase subunit delta [Novosphingobium mangrovi (ex Huang et al. 2023)]|uniref:ATP synthase subunit b n=1 Tax=Novosphingobium mangrovi (ex Huang et al. 2023) TaxID=2976432 RepID=A0ABT2I0W8_9SPHN|nr:F0F1 ATP synthase subunit delta [Novosphingobium mangrovi (ex Huang et al. 2023)]MCT2398449.1 F0F1 ATP synthase subunit delta [Novosphingobium mangrovi (ex Huang et al. 2023)]